MKPSSALIIVLLPAPFGPSSPTAPGANAAVTSRSASLRPYLTVTTSSVTTALFVPESGMFLDYTVRRTEKVRAQVVEKNVRYKLPRTPRKLVAHVFFDGLCADLFGPPDRIVKKHARFRNEQRGGHARRGDGEVRAQRGAARRDGGVRAGRGGTARAERRGQEHDDQGAARLHRARPRANARAGAECRRGAARDPRPRRLHARERRPHSGDERRVVRRVLRGAGRPAARRRDAAGAR